MGGCEQKATVLSCIVNKNKIPLFIVWKTGQEGPVRGYFNNSDDSCQWLKVRGGEKPSVCVLKVELNEMWNLRETGGSRIAPALDKRNSKRKERSRLALYQENGLGCVKFRMIQGHPGGQLEIGVRGQGQEWDWTTNSNLSTLQAIYLTNPSWNFRRSLLK